MEVTRRPHKQVGQCAPVFSLVASSKGLFLEKVPEVTQPLLQLDVQFSGAVEEDSVDNRHGLRALSSLFENDLLLESFVTCRCWVQTCQFTVDKFEMTSISVRLLQ